MKIEATHWRGVVQREFGRLFVPVDFTPGSIGALRFAGILAERFGSTIYLLHVVETHPFAMSDGASVLMKSDEESASDATDQLGRLAREHLPDLPMQSLVRRGRPAREILRTAAMLEADLIILAAHRHTAFGRILLGSTVAQVERRARCPLLVVQGDFAWAESLPESSADRLQLSPATGGAA
jgi:nucleotide-binding universal stress UspA family protein